ncbi:MAG: type II toxin-antitoxin system HicB family antitoxin [Candidatus Thiodiazotropha sp.]
MMAYQYTALIRKNPETDYWVDCPDLPGCIASGKSIEEAKAQFADAIHFHLVGVKDQKKGYSLPIPRSRKQVLAEEEDEYLEAYTVTVDEPFMTQ